jgi:hypothetical protein
MDNFFVLFTILELQAATLSYFILSLVVFPRGEYLQKFFKSIESFAKQPKYEINSALFSQF